MEVFPVFKSGPFYVTKKGTPLSLPKRTPLGGRVLKWKILGPVPWNETDLTLDKAWLGEPDVDPSRNYEVEGTSLAWEDCTTKYYDGMVDLAPKYGRDENLAVYAYAEVTLAKAGLIELRVGSNDGFKCWFNGEEAGRFDGGRGYKHDQDSLTVTGREGSNTILLKVSQMGGDWAFGVRLTKPNGAPIEFEQ